MHWNAVIRRSFKRTETVCIHFPTSEGYVVDIANNYISCCRVKLLNLKINNSNKELYN